MRQLRFLTAKGAAVRRDTLDILDGFVCLSTEAHIESRQT
jgi:hypothetical protein